MQPSTELSSLYQQSCDAMSHGDHSFFERHFSQHDGVVAIGTDPAEWWPGYDAITRVFEAQLGETGGISIIADAPLAYSEGSTGWFAGQPVIQLQDGTEIPARLTAVWVKEDDGWKIVQWHFSTGVANKEALGETLTT